MSAKIDDVIFTISNIISNQLLYLISVIISTEAIMHHLLSQQIQLYINIHFKVTAIFVLMFMVESMINHVSEDMIMHG